MILLFIVAFTTGILRDIIYQKNIQLKKTAEERDKALKDLKASLETIKKQERLAGVGEFSSIVAHEVRNPLYGMLGAVEIIEKKIKREDKEYFCISTLKKEIERLKKLTESFLLYSSPSIVKEKKKVNISSLLDNIVSFFKETEKNTS